MLKAYETEGHGIYWQVFFEDTLGETYIKDMDSLDEVLQYARKSALKLQLFTQEWYEKETENA